MMRGLNALHYPQGNKEQLTENKVVKNTPITFIIAQKKSVMVLRRQNDLWDFTTPTRDNASAQLVITCSREDPIS